MRWREAVAAGAEKLVFVTGASKRGMKITSIPIRSWNGPLEESGKADLLASLRDILPPSASCLFIRQGVPLGLGHAVLCARAAVGGEPFFVHLGRRPHLRRDPLPGTDESALRTPRRQRIGGGDRARRANRQLRIVAVEGQPLRGAENHRYRRKTKACPMLPPISRWWDVIC